MFVIFILAIILPLILMAVLSYNKASLMLTMDPAEVIQSLLYLTAFLLAVTLAVAVILSHLFSIGIIEPVRRMEAAMSRVERGDLKATVTVNSNDELGVLAENFNQMTDAGPLKILPGDLGMFFFKFQGDQLSVFWQSACQPDTGITRQRADFEDAPGLHQLCYPHQEVAFLWANINLRQSNIGSCQASLFLNFALVYKNIGQIIGDCYLYMFRE